MSIFFMTATLLLVMAPPTLEASPNTDKVAIEQQEQASIAKRLGLSAPMLGLSAPMMISGLMYPNSPFKKRAAEASAEVKIADSLLKSGRLDEAALRYPALLKPENEGTNGFSGALAGLAEIDTRQGKYDEALAFYRRLVYVQSGQQWITSRSNDLDIRMKFAILLHRTGHFEEALTNYNKGLEHVPLRTLDTRMPLSISLLAVDDQTVKTNRLPYAAHVAIAAYRKDYDDAEAEAHLREAIRLRPNFAPTYYYLACLLRRRPEMASEMRTLVQKATELGDVNVQFAIEERFKDFLQGEPQRNSPPFLVNPK